MRFKLLFFIILVAIGAYGGYRGYCRYQVGEQIYCFNQAITDLRQGLLRLNRAIGPDDVKQFILLNANQCRVAVNPQEIQVIIEPLTNANMQKLSQVAQTAIGIAAKMTSHNTPPWIVGFKARFLAKYGKAQETFEAKQFTWFDLAQP